MLRNVIVYIKAMTIQFSKAVFYDPILSIIHPKTIPPITSPNPNAIIAYSAFDSALVSSTSTYCNTMIGVRIPDQKAIDNPVHISYVFKYIILGDTINFKVDIRTALNEGFSSSELNYSKRSILASPIFYGYCSLQNPKTAINMINDIIAKKLGPDVSSMM